MYGSSSKRSGANTARDADIRTTHDDNSVFPLLLHDPGQGDHELGGLDADSPVRIFHPWPV